MCALFPLVHMKMIIDPVSSFTTEVTAIVSILSLEEIRAVAAGASVYRAIEDLLAVLRAHRLPVDHKDNVKIVLRAATSEASTALLRSSEGTFRVHKIFGDGNCMFRAVSYILWGNEDEHRALRSLVTRHIRDHWWEYGPFVMAEWNITSPEEYSSFMMNEGVFATELECTVATKLHKMNLSIYREIGGSAGDDVKRVFHNRVNGSYDTARLLFSGRSESGHYDVLFLER